MLRSASGRPGAVCCQLQPRRGRAGGSGRTRRCRIACLGLRHRQVHHTRKLDAPSGTALALGAAAQRSGAEPRYASLRAGDIVGEHLVQFAGQGERIELIHRATNRDIFARGALHAAARLAARAPGNYRLRDLLD